MRYIVQGYYANTKDEEWDIDEVDELQEAKEKISDLPATDDGKECKYQIYDTLTRRTIKTEKIKI